MCNVSFICSITIVQNSKFPSFSRSTLKVSRALVSTPGFPCSERSESRVSLVKWATAVLQDSIVCLRYHCHFLSLLAEKGGVRRLESTAGNVHQGDDGSLRKDSRHAHSQELFLEIYVKHLCVKSTHFKHVLTHLRCDH